MDSFREMIESAYTASGLLEDRDEKPLTGCDCEFAPYPEGDDDFGEESTHYLRVCGECGKKMWSNHCPHDKRQIICHNCGYLLPVESEKENTVDNSILSVTMSLQHREALLAFQKSVIELQNQSGIIKCDPRNVHRLNGYVDKEIGRDGRIRLYSWLVGREFKTTTNLTDKEAAGMLRFAQPEKVGKGIYEYSHEFEQAVQAVKNG